ncbi:hypothetical protein DLM45_07060 [Hyphomicrobium methylovorum]|uniref:hypothetical protein n=1 Tax=Hyphomicrobium methylovorum TaxID=84 RepID=UPI0015E78570|nr:hypothetical protein [Hyphomicrobium methylovorum]MBA2125982.1 hypothetical protein [Hyphomicrobium methylovorum]
MARLHARSSIGNEPSDVAIETVAHRGDGVFTILISALALLFSGYSLWESSLKAPALEVFVPPVIHYTSPYNNTNFEVIQVPVTILNDGGRTGTVLSMRLEATNTKTKEKKNFYAADFGRWSMEKTRNLSYEPFAPMPLAGKASRTETILFYTKGPEEKPDQLIREPGTYHFRLILDEATSEGFGFLDRFGVRGPAEVSFDMDLREYDARAFQVGTLPLYSTSGQSAKSTNQEPH